MTQEKDIPTISMKTVTLNVTLKDVFGGDGVERFQEIEHQTINKAEKQTITKSTMPGIEPPVRLTNKIVTVKDNVPVATFEVDEKGRPILPLGRKVRGTIKAIGKNLADIQHPLFPYKSTVDRMIQMVNVEPEYIILSEDKNWRDNGNYYFATSPQPLKGIGGGFIGKHYDAVKEIKTTIVIKYPEIYEGQIKSIVQLLPTVKTLNRRMTKIIIDKSSYT